MSVFSHVFPVYDKRCDAGVKGVSWGNYVGSPSDSSPSVIWQQQHRTPVASLIPLLTNDVFGLAPSTALLLAYSKVKPKPCLG